MLKILLSLLICVTTIIRLEAQSDADFTIGTNYTMNSSILRESRSYIISLPESYEGDEFYRNKSYPVLILLDGQRLFHLVSGMVETMSSPGVEQIPEMIIVGVVQEDRNQELTPTSVQNNNTTTHSEQFRKFIEDELIPEINKNYRTLDCQILVGHSYGGLFAVETFLESSAFEGFLAIDPSLWWENEIINTRAQEALNQEKIQSTPLFISQANNPFNEGIASGRLGQAIQGFKQTLEQKEMDGARFEFKFYPEEDHFSIPTISIYEGLQYIFKGYRYPLNKIATAEIDEIASHYQALSERFGSLLPPGKLLNQVGSFLINNEGQVEKGIALLEFNKENYSDSYLPYQALGDIYGRQGNAALALENYNKALKINPSSLHLKARIEELNN